MVVDFRRIDIILFIDAKQNVQSQPLKEAMRQIKGY